MRATLALALALALAACKAPSPPTSTPTPTTPKTAAPESRALDTARELDLSARPPRRAAGKELSERWLIILDSEGDEDKRADRLKKLNALDVDKAPMTLSSTEFKGLMPCYDVLIANHFADRKAAIAYSKELTAAGVGNYPKNAGKYVGAQPAVSAYCARKERGADASGCGDGLLLAASHGGRTFVHLALDEVAAERAVQKAPAPTKLDGNDAWVQPLEAVKLGALKVGDRVAVLPSGGEANPQPCAVKGFAALTRGTPHFSSTNSDKPTCGEPEVFAELDCQVRDPALAWRADADAAAARKTPLKSGQALPVDDKLLATGASARARGQAHAKEQGAKLQEKSWDTRWSLAGATLRHGHLTLTTGEGFSECGGPDFKAELDGWSTDAKILRGLEEHYNKQTLGVVSAGGKTLEVYREHFGDVALRELDGDERCRLTLPFCDCGC